MIWRCNEKYKGNTKCSTPHVTEEEVKEKFVEAFNSILEHQEELIANCRLAQETICDYADIDAEIDALRREMEVVAELSRKAIYENAHTVINQEEWQERNNGYLERHQMASERVNELEELKRERQCKSLMLDGFIQNLATCGKALETFDERIWVAAIDKVVVQSDGELVFGFKDGTKIVR